jgi:alpha-amylase
MADDLGDSHAKSLKQGGRLPANSTAQRTVGRIFAVSGKPITTMLFPEINGRSQRIVVYNVSGGIVASITGTSSNTAPLTLNYTPTATGWYTIRINNTSSTVSAQKAWVNVSYTAPSSVDTRTSPAPTFRMNQQDPLTNETPVTTYSIYPNPTQGVLKFDIRNIQNDQVLDCILTDASGSTIAKLQNTLTGLEKTIGGILTNKSGGVYFIQLNLNQQLYNFRIIKY